MADSGRERRPTAEDDRDVADLTWLTGLVRRLARRVFPDAPAGEGPADGEPTPPGDAPPTPRSAPSIPPAPPTSAALGPPNPADPAEPAESADRADPAEARSARATATLEEQRAPEPKTAPELEAGSPSLQARLERVRQSTAYRLTAAKYTLPIALAVFIGLICLHNQFDGVDWGDDFALYVNQAKALTEGSIGEVLADNRFTVDNSGWQSFSPYSYPWGWPALMAPFYAVFGLDYGVFKFLEVLALCVFLVAFYFIVRRRAGTLPALLLTAAVGVSRSYNGATDGVLSDLPYLAFVGLSLWWMDVCRQKGILTLSSRRSVVLGLLLAYTYNIRREGLSLWVALIALHLAVLAGVAMRERSVKALRQVNWRRISIPYVTLGAFLIVFQLLLPTVFLPRAPGAALSNIPFRYGYYQDAVAEHVGLKDPGLPMELFGSAHTARQALTLLAGLAVVGVLFRLVLRFEQEIHLAAYLSCTTFLMLVSPYQDSRYFFTITPLLLYFAFQAFPATVELFSSSKKLLRLAVLPPLIPLVGIIALNSGDLTRAYEYHSVYSYTVNGPESPEAKQMFTALKDMSRGDDVILFFRARAMTLYSQRRAIQGSDLDRLLKRADWYVMAKNSTYSQTPLSDEEGAARGLTKAWENGGWVIWRVPPPT